MSWQVCLVTAENILAGKVARNDTGTEGIMARFRWIAVLIIMSFMVVMPAGMGRADDNTVLDEVRYILENYYVKEVPAEVLRASSVKECLKMLGDEYTKYWTKQDYANFMDNMEPHFGGLGVYMEAEAEGMKVIGVIEGTPADKVGLKAGDIILSVNGVSLKGKSADEGQVFLKGAEGSKAYLQVRRGDSALSFTAVRTLIELPTVSGEIVDKYIGYIDIDAFGPNTQQEFDRLVRKLDQDVKVWMIDLRDNGGGFFDTALALAGYFIGDEVALYMEERGSYEEIQAYPQTMLIDKPVILMVNENSASSAEILAAALKAHNKTWLVGENSFGKGSVQSVLKLSNGDYMKVTIAHFFSPLLEEINGVGVRPHVVVSSGEALERGKELAALALVLGF